MEQQQRSLVFTAAVGLIILAIIIGSVYYLVKFIQGRVATSRQTTQTAQTLNPEGTSSAQLTPEFIDSQNPNPEQDSSQMPPTPGNPPSDKKIYNGGTFQLAYPNNWGVLSCANSSNIEFDPANPNDAKTNCDIASKPITVVVGDTKGCSDETIKIGNLDVAKSKVNEGSYIKYQWCTKTQPVLNITHRVSPDSERATSKEDYSNQVEQIISNLSFVRGS